MNKIITAVKDNKTFTLFLGAVLLLVIFGWQPLVAEMVKAPIKNDIDVTYGMPTPTDEPASLASLMTKYEKEQREHARTLYPRRIPTTTIRLSILNNNPCSTDTTTQRGE